MWPAAEWGGWKRTWKIQRSTFFASVFTEQVFPQVSSGLCADWLSLRERSTDHSKRGSSYGLLKHIGHKEIHRSRQHAEGTGQLYCETRLYHLWKPMMVRGGPQWSEKGILKIARRRIYLQDNYRTVGPKSVPGKVTEQIILEAIFKCMKAKKGIGNGQHGFTNNKWCLISMTVFCDEMAGPVDNGRAADVIDLGFSKIFSTFSYSIVIAKLRSFVLDR